MCEQYIQRYLQYVQKITWYNNNNKWNHAYPLLCSGSFTVIAELIDLRKKHLVEKRSMLSKVSVNILNSLIILFMGENFETSTLLN